MKKENIKKCIMVLFILYCLVLIYVLFCHNVYRYEYDAIGINNMLSKEHLQMINIIPFFEMLLRQFAADC